MNDIIKPYFKNSHTLTTDKKKIILRKHLKIKKISPNKTVLLAGSGRSGTTWLANIIGSCAGFGILFEPFDHRKVPEAKKFPLRTYLRPEKEYPQERRFAENILCGRIHNNWIDRENKNFLIWRYLVKSIRANLFLAWIDFNFHCPIIYIIRHPCAVVLSRLKLNWDTHLDVFLNQEKLMEDYLYGFEHLIKKAKKPIQKHAITWCVENLIPLSQFSQHDWIFCAYENLCTNTTEEIARILEKLGIKQRIRTNQAINNFYQTRKDSAIRNGRDPISDWKKSLSTHEIEEILSIVRAFGIKLYEEELLPVPEHLKGLSNHE